MSKISAKIREMFADNSGVVTVEAAIVLPFLSIVGIGVADCSYMLLQNHKMEQSLVSAANFMALSTDPQRFEIQAKQIAISGTTDLLSEPLIENLSTANVSISYVLVPNTNGKYRGGDFIRVVNIKTSLPYEGFGFIKSIMRGGVTLNAQYQQRMTGTVT
jgi:Flp pilus assembly protein TadG